MFKKLFGGGGGGSNQPSQPQQPQNIDPTATIERLEQQCEQIEKRIVVINNKVKDAKALALQKNKAGDKRGALLALKQSKMYEGELSKLDGQQIMLEQQKMTI